MITYNVYRNGEKIKSGLTEKVFKDSDLAPNTEYTYQVSAVNSTGESELSEPIATTTEPELEPVEQIDETEGEPISVEISPKNNNLSEIGVIRYLKAAVLPETADQSVTWSSADKSVAIVNEEGKITAAGPGATTITATAINGVVGTATVNVAGT
ncbi:Ig-like domain-containing protein [Paenibacillus ihumii]|uniref:Ig-like domain-containing protein n=1 Tax=Paenibacillus ihumii TaxID=687436 RepID=UPI0006D76C62|nr:Ig-like domain-containing protein [Paenibacillus ihumii]